MSVFLARTKPPPGDGPTVAVKVEYRGTPEPIEGSDAPTALARRAIRCWLLDAGYPPDAAAVERVLAVVEVAPRSPVSVLDVGRHEHFASQDSLTRAGHHSFQLG